MDYAEDRLDRRSWQQDVTLLSQEFHRCWTKNNHAGLARLCLSLGWNRHAIFHHAVCWMEEPSNERAAADYAQMTDLAGFSEVSLMAVLVFRSKGQLSAYPIQSCLPSVQVPLEHFQKSATQVNGMHCGCGSKLCGTYSCFVPMDDASILAVINCFTDYCVGRLSMIRQCQARQYSARENTRGSPSLLSIPTACEVLQMITERKPFDLSERSPALPRLLQFWNRKTYGGSLRPLSPVVQLLLVKLLFLMVPTIAVEVVVYIRFDNEKDQNETLANKYKSHWAYFVFIQSLALGERIKPERRRMLKFYHIPLWNRLWGIDLDDAKNIDKKERSSQVESRMLSQTFLSELQSLLFALKEQRCANNDALRVSRVWMPLQCLFDFPPLFLLGDSHVLSLAWQILHLPTNSDKKNSSHFRLVVPILTTGLKAWHFRSCTRFFTNSCLQTTLRQRLQPNIQTILVSAGEIDCREGIGGKVLERYTQTFHDCIQRTVTDYVQALVDLVADHGLRQILVLPVAPHLHHSKGRFLGQMSRRETMQVWNDELRRQLPISVESKVKGGALHFLDYTSQLLIDDGTFALDPIFNADSTHMNSAFAPHLEKALMDCGFDRSLI